MHQIPSSLPPLFSGDRLVVYGVLKASENENEGDDNEVRLEGMLGSDEKVEHLVKFSSLPIAVENKGYALLHQLAAKSSIQENQDGYSERNYGQEFEEAKRSIISISKTANVVSTLTSFVAVDKDSNQPVTGPLRKHFVPSPPAFACRMPMAYCMAIPRRGAVAGGGDAEIKGGGLPPSHYGATLLSSSPVSYTYCATSITGDYDRDRDRLSSGDEDSNTAAASTFHARKKGGFGFSSSKSRLESSARKKKSKGFFSSLFGSTASAPAPTPENIFCTVDRLGSQKKFDGDFEKSQKTKEALGALGLISLQKAPGSWDLTDKLVSLCGTNRDALNKGCPKEIAVDTGEGKLLWATALALVLLMGKFLNQKDEWEMIAEKGTKWMKKNLPAAVKYENVLEAAASTVGVQMKLGQ